MSVIDVAGKRDIIHVPSSHVSHWPMLSAFVRLGKGFCSLLLRSALHKLNVRRFVLAWPIPFAKLPSSVVFEALAANSAALQVNLERFEFVGDAVLLLSVAKSLFEQYPVCFILKIQMFT